MLCLSYYLLCFLFDKIREEEDGTGSAWKQDWRVDQTMYTHVSKCKNKRKRDLKFCDLHGSWKPEGSPLSVPFHW
jgi:hypothetical protein